MSLSTESPKTTDLAIPKGFLSVPREAFRFSQSPGVEIYSWEGDDSAPLLLSNEQHAITDADCRKWTEEGRDILLIRISKLQKLSSVLYGAIDEIVNDQSVPPEMRCSLLQLAYSAELERLFRPTHREKFFELGCEVGRKISKLVQQGAISAPTLFDLVHHTPANYVHLTNVTFYLLILAQLQGIDDPEELDRLAIGSMLHETGKLFLPQELLTKTGRLTPHERQELEKAPLLAYETLSEYEELGVSELMMAYQQAERVDGSGYPVGLVGSEIDLWARMLAVVDVFDAMTASRIYRRASKLPDSLSHLTDSADKHFDSEIAQCWISTFQRL